MKRLQDTYLIIPGLVLSLALAGCSTWPGKAPWQKGAALTDYNPQNFQGCTVAEYIQPVESNADEPEAFTIRWWDCKDKDSVAGDVDLDGDGTPDFSYSASNVVGSEAAAIRSQVEKAFAEAGVEILPGMVESIVDGILGVP